MISSVYDDDSSAYFLSKPGLLLLIQPEKTLGDL